MQRRMRDAKKAEAEDETQTAVFTGEITHPVYSPDSLPTDTSTKPDARGAESSGEVLAGKTAFHFRCRPEANAMNQRAPPNGHGGRRGKIAVKEESIPEERSFDCVRASLRAGRRNF